MTSSAYFPNTNRLFAMRGPDARDFLHRLTTVNVRALPIGGLKTGCFLNPQGRIRVAFRIACASEDSFLIELGDNAEGTWTKEFLAVIDQFTFAENYQLEEKTGLANAWIFSLPKGRSNELELRGDLSFFHLSHSLFDASLASLWGPKESLDAFIASIHSAPLSEAEFEKNRILSLFPRIDREILPDANPLELGMRNAIDDQKGCYPGQEVIEKIISLGSPAKRLARVESAVPFVVGSKLYIEDAKTEVGTVSSVAADEGKTIGLALLRKNALEIGKLLKLENGAVAKVASLAHYE